MMKSNFLLAICLMVGLALNAQDKKQVLELSYGDTLTNVVDKSVQYAFDEFTDGTVLYKDGSRSKAKMNYNYLVGEMQFMDLSSSNKVLSLANISDVVMVTISDEQFIPLGSDLEFMQLITKGDVRLAAKRKGKARSMGKKGAMGITNPTSRVVSLTEYATDNEVRHVEAAEDMKISIDNTYYLYGGEKNGVTQIKGVKAYLKNYPKDKSTLIEQYAKDNKVNFYNEKDLIKLTEYCNKL